MAAAIVRPTSLAGGVVQFLVVAGGPRWCAAIDLSSGALRLARWPDAGPAFPPYTLARAEVAADQRQADPARPEDVVLTARPAASGKLRRRRAERWLRPLLHPEGQDLLGSTGADVAYWTVTADRPSVAVVAPARPPVLLGNRCSFSWQHVSYALPVLVGARQWCPPRPRRLLVVLSGPRDGRCYKVVAALL
ncbi:MAG: hypothetical protein ACRD1K_01880 [Acidimicrobiales bacterium]